MKVILQKDLGRKGSMGDIVEVSEGYARNYLIPKGIAKKAEESNIKALEHNRKVVQNKINKEQKEAEKIAEKLSSHSCTVTKKVGEDEKLFGSVTTADIEEALTKDGFSVSRKDIMLEEHIKALGVYTIPVKIRAGVTANLKVWVVKE